MFSVLVVRSGKACHHVWHVCDSRAGSSFSYERFWPDAGWERGFRFINNSNYCWVISWQVMIHHDLILFPALWANHITGSQTITATQEIYHCTSDYKHNGCVHNHILLTVFCIPCIFAYGRCMCCTHSMSSMVSFQTYLVTPFLPQIRCAAAVNWMFNCEFPALMCLFYLWNRLNHFTHTISL